MPLYPFYCKKCQKKFEIFLNLSEANQNRTCPSCNGTEVERWSEREQDNVISEICGVQKDT